MTAPIINQLIRSGFSVAAMRSMAGPNSNKWQSFLNSALSAGYGVGEIIDFLQANEAPSKRRFREKTERRIAEGVAQPTEEAAVPERQSRPGQALSGLAVRAAPLAAAGNLSGLLDRRQQGTQEAQSATPPPIPPAPQSANAMPQNAQNRLAGIMKKAQSKGPLSIDSLMQQDQERRMGQMALRAAGAMRASVADIAPTVFEQAQALVQRMSPAEASMQIRKSAKRMPAIAKEISRLRRERGMKLEDVIAQEFGASMQQQTPQGQASEDDVIAQIMNYMDQL